MQMPRWTIVVVGFCWAIVAGPACADDLDAVRALIGEIKVRVEHKTETSEAADAARPPLRADGWTFLAGGVNPAVRYNRYLNHPPEFTGSHPSLVGSDMGLGLDGGPFGNWYRGNAIRVLLDGQDVLAESSAVRMEAQEGAEGRLGLAWEAGNGRRVTVSFVVPRDGRAVYACVDIEPGLTPIRHTELRLTCYPGGFAPAYGLPSHRYIRTATASAEVGPDSEPTADRPYPTVRLGAGNDWVFYGDRITGNGGLGLLLNREDRPTGEVRLSNYGISTVVTYPEGTRRLCLGFFAYSLENQPAEQAFVAGLEREREALSTDAFCADSL